MLMKYQIVKLLNTQLKKKKFITLAVRRPLVNVGLSHWFSLRPVSRILHPTSPRDLYQVVRTPRGRPSHAALAITWSPLKNLSAPSAIGLPSYMTCPLPLQLADSLFYDWKKNNNNNIQFYQFPGSHILALIFLKTYPSNTINAKFCKNGYLNDCFTQKGWRDLEKNLAQI